MAAAERDFGSFPTLAPMAFAGIVIWLATKGNA